MKQQESVGVYIRLSVMMFIEFAIWGSWAVLIAGHMQHLGFTGKQISYVFGTTAFGALLSPLIAGWVADRFMPNQIFTAICHFVGAGLLAVAFHQHAFAGLWTAILFYSVLYMPTIALTNAIAFYHMGNSTRFGMIRVWGTLGWIAVNWALSFYLHFWEVRMPGVNHEGECLLVAAVLSVVMGLYCLTLPNTPPVKEAQNPYAFLEAFQLMVDRNFAVLLLISFIVAIELPFYYNLTLLFLTEPVHGVGLLPSQANFAMSLGQVGETIMMLLLWPAVRYLGMRTTIFLGILAWPVRYAIFAIGHPAGLVIAAQGLHGICYAFFFAGGMIAVERLSHKDIRASAQGLIVFATNGVGMLVGHIISGRLHDYFRLPDGGHAWAKIFMVPIAVTVIAGIVFLAMFSEEAYQETAARIDSEDQQLTAAASTA